jgi:hypothetical protein
MPEEGDLYWSDVAQKGFCAHKREAPECGYEGCGQQGGSWIARRYIQSELLLSTHEARHGCKRAHLLRYSSDVGNYPQPTAANTGMQFEDWRAIRSGPPSSRSANASAGTQFIIQHVCVGVEGISLRKSNSRPEVNELLKSMNESAKEA